MSHQDSQSFYPTPRQLSGAAVLPKGRVIYDLTFAFCHAISLQGRPHRRSVWCQTARSGKQNIVEGSKASTRSKEPKSS